MLLAGAADEIGSGKKRQRAGSVKVRQLDAEKKKEYFHEKFMKSKSKNQEKWMNQFKWLAVHETYGIHCSVCIGTTIKASDALSTKGYGYFDEGEEGEEGEEGGTRRLIPIPSLQKLHAHEAKPQHQSNVKKRAAGSESTAAMQPFVTITPEEDLCE